MVKYYTQFRVENYISLEKQYIYVAVHIHSQTFFYQIHRHGRPRHHRLWRGIRNFKRWLREIEGKPTEAAAASRSAKATTTSTGKKDSLRERGKARGGGALRLNSPVNLFVRPSSLSNSLNPHFILARLYSAGHESWHIYFAWRLLCAPTSGLVLYACVATQVILTP